MSGNKNVLSVANEQRFGVDVLGLSGLRLAWFACGTSSQTRLHPALDDEASYANVDALPSGTHATYEAVAVQFKSENGPEDLVRAEQVRAFFKERRLDGNARALMSFHSHREEAKGDFVTVPDEERCLVFKGQKLVPRSQWGAHGNTTLDVQPLEGGWPLSTWFVGFRLVG